MAGHFLAITLNSDLYGGLFLFLLVFLLSLICVTICQWCVWSFERLIRNQIIVTSKTFFPHKLLFLILIMNRKSTLNQKRSATISEFRFITEENTEANALLQQEQQQPKLKQDQSLLQQYKRTQSQTKLTKVLPYKVTRSKSVHAFQEYGKGFVGSR